MSKHAKNPKAVHKRAARGADPIISESRSRIEIWRPGYVAETPSMAGEESLETSSVTKGKPAVRARIKPTPKAEGGE